MSTAMFHTGLDPRTMQPVYVPKDYHQKAMQRALMQYYNPVNHKLVREALIKAGRDDLIGWSNSCLIPPYVRERKKDDKPVLRGKDSKGGRNSRDTKAGKDAKTGKDAKKTGVAKKAAPQPRGERSRPAKHGGKSGRSGRK